MEQGPDLSDLQERVESVGKRFGEVADDSRRRGERLADLLDEVESGFVRNRLEIDRLRQALAKSQEENGQILDLLQRLLGVAEHAGGLGERAALYDLEARVDRLYDQTVSMIGPGAEPPDGPEEAARNAGATAGNGTYRTAGESANGRAPHDRASHDRASHERSPEDPRWEQIPDDDDDDEGGPLELTRMTAQGGGRDTLRRSASRTVLAESGAVQDIFKRVSLITGRLRET